MLFSWLPPSACPIVATTTAVCRFFSAQWVKCYITNEGCVVSTILTQIKFGTQERARWRRYEWL